MKLFRSLITSLSLISLCIACNAPTKAPEASKILDHVKLLASDSLQGRGTGTAGERMAASYIESQFKSMGLQAMGVNGTYLQEFEFNSGIHGTGEPGKANNIIAYLDNGAVNTIVIGAHYDHLGTGEDVKSLDANPQGKIHNGADDNASGVAGLLELARYFKSNSTREKNNFLFICFSGEELGLFGSKYFTDNPTIDLSKVDFMINLDMIGRLDPKNGISVSGSGTSPGWEPLLQKLSTPEVAIKTDSSGTGPSDHTSFYLKNLPVLHFFTGSHSDYHKPSDDYEKINLEGEIAVLGVIIKLIEAVDAEPKLTFLTTKSKSMGGSRSFKVTLGIMPSYSAKEAGLKVDGVSDGKPAQKAGILTGDIIVQMGEISINDIEAYMGALGKFEKGQIVPVKVLRAGKELTVNVEF